MADDGRGLDTDRIKAKVLASGLATEAELEQDVRGADPEVHLHAGLFHRDQTITSVSGRGVGMDVVRNNIDQIGGTIDVQFGAAARA